MPTDEMNGTQIRPKRESAESKAETTKRVSEELLRVESEVRDAKTARLKAARLEMLAQQETAAASKSPAPARKRSGRASK